MPVSLSAHAIITPVTIPQFVNRPSTDLSANAGLDTLVILTGPVAGIPRMLALLMRSVRMMLFVKLALVLLPVKIPVGSIQCVKL